ncbi:MFS transporter [Prosthecobacter sp.]|uniref:MFS transporter n=1 Tax=Prosthecobacter sp. TaxID=1965333 RepID=UPI0037841681
MTTFLDKTDRRPLEAATQNSFRPWALASLSLSMLLSSLGTSIANVGLPVLGEVFAASFQEVQWVVLAYLLAITALIVGAGRLGDIMGRRRLLLSGLSLFTVASIACGTAGTLRLLIAARAAQGLGAAIMMALTMAFAGGITPKEKTGSVMGMLGTMSAIGTALGPTLGGTIIAGWSWRGLFLINVPLGLLTLVLAWIYLPAGPAKPLAERPRFDHAGTWLLALSLAAYALAMTLGRSHFELRSGVLLLGAAVGGGLFVLVERRSPSPLIRLSMLRDPRLSANLVMSVLVSAVVMTTLVVGPFYLTRALGLDAAHAGLVMSVGPLAAALTGVPAGRVADRWGAPRMILAGLIGMAVGCLLQSLLPDTAGSAGYVAALVILTTGYALFQTASNTSVMAGAAAENRGVISGMLNLSRNLGLITGTAVMGAVFAHAAGASHITTASADAIASGMRTTFTIATALILVAILISIIARPKAPF